MAPRVLKESARRPRRDKLVKLMKEKVKSFAVLYREGTSAESKEFNITKVSDEPMIRVGVPLLVEDSVHVDVIETLGKGSFGEVFKIKTSHLDDYLAMKVVSTKTSRHLEKANHEIDLLTYLMDRNVGEFVLEIYHSFWLSKNNRDLMCHVSELLDKPLADILDATRTSALHPVVVKAIGFQVLSALERLHNLGVTHCDIKPDNVMFVDMQNSKLRVKLIDFGNSHFTWKMEQGTRMQNLLYRAPEVLFGMPLSEKLDIWSFAVVLSEMFTGLDLFLVDYEPQLARFIEDYVGLPSGAAFGVSAGHLLIYDVVEERVRAMSYRETQKEKITDCDKDMRVMKSLEDVPLFGYNNRANGKVSEEDRQFLDVLVKMMKPNAAERFGAKEALESEYFASFDGDYNPLLLDSESPVAGKVQIGSLYETFSSGSSVSTTTTEV